MTEAKKIILDLNGHKLSAPSRVLSIESGYFEVVGPGSIVETNPYYAPIVIKGSNDPADTGYTTVKVGEGVYLEGWTGVFFDALCIERSSICIWRDCRSRLVL